jgi:branched-chain amino acid aminotransferase
LLEAYRKGQLKEAFGTGTAAVIALIKELKYKEFILAFDLQQTPVAQAVKQQLANIRGGQAPDTHQWMWPV